MNIEPNVWLPRISGLIGAVIGAAASVLTVIVQARNETRRHRIGVLADLALKEVIAAAENSRLSGFSGTVAPPVVYMHFYGRVLTLIESGELNPQTFREITKGEPGILQGGALRIRG